MIVREPDSEVDDRAIGCDWNADERHKSSALGMWLTGSEAKTCFTMSGPIPNLA